LLQASPFKLDEIDQVITPTIKELFPDEQLIMANEIYKKELDKVLQRAEELRCLISGNEATQMAQSRLQLVEISLKVHHQQIIKEKEEMQAQQMKMKSEIAKQINAIALFSETFKTRVCMKIEDGQTIVDQQQVKLFEQLFQLTDETNDEKTTEKFLKNN